MSSRMSARSSSDGTSDASSGRSSTRTSRLLLTGVVGLAGIGVGAALAPVAAGAASTTTKVVHDRAAAIKDALSGLVKDGTLTQEQADKVAETLADRAPGPRGMHGWAGGVGPDGRVPAGPGWPGPAGLDTAAEVLGTSVKELRAALADGKTLAQVAGSKGLTQDELVDKLVAAATSQLDEAVKAGRLTQEQADRIKDGLKDRITARVTQPWHQHGLGEGRQGWHRAPGHQGNRGPGGTTGPSTPTRPGPSSSTTS